MMNRSYRALPWLPALLVLAVYFPALGASFQFDDWQGVLDDARVASLAAWWESMPGMRALVKLSYALNHAAGGAVEVFRATNLLLHAVNASLVFLLARSMARRLRNVDEAGASVVAAVTALVFALHPVQTESVTYITGRSNEIATLFCLLTLLAWLRSREPGAGWKWLLPVVPGFIAALAGKETAAVLPLAMLLCLAVEPRQRWRDADVAVLLMALCIGLFIAAWPHLPYDYLVRTSLETHGPLENLLVQSQGVTWLLEQLLRWDLLNADPMLRPETTLTLPVLLQAAVLAAMLLVGLIGIRRWPVVAFGVLWFFLWLAPTNSLLARLDVANDRQLYCALIGPGWLLGHAMAKLGRHAWIGLLPLATLLALGTASRNRVYATEVTFWEDVVIKSPHNTRAWNNLGMAEAVACHADAAKLAFGEALHRDAQDFQADINLALLERGELPGVPAHCVPTPAVPDVRAPAAVPAAPTPTPPVAPRR
jgi:protein O-mannosyl-transferase